MLKSDLLNIDYRIEQSPLCHKDEIKMLINDRHVGILCVSEIWLISSLHDSLVRIPCFSIHRPYSGRGGGACIYVWDDFKVAEITTGIEKVEGVEYVWLTVMQETSFHNCRLPILTPAYRSCNF